MIHSLEFERLVEYDVGEPGISLAVNLKLVGKSVSVETKIDTGSTSCVFARSAGESLGLEIESGELVRIGTATGVFTTYRHDVVLEVLGYEFDARVCFAENESFRRNVLGRFGFLDRIVLGLVDYEGKLFLKRYELI
jgi:hypothetical protein